MCTSDQALFHSFSIEAFSCNMTGKKMGEIDGSGSGAGLCLILAIFCLGFIVPILAQSTLNNAAEKTAN